MPWEPEDAPRHAHKAGTAHLCKLWSQVANSVLEETGDEGRAVRAAIRVIEEWFPVVREETDE